MEKEINENFEENLVCTESLLGFNKISLRNKKIDTD